MVWRVRGQSPSTTTIQADYAISPRPPLAQWTVYNAVTATPLEPWYGSTPVSQGSAIFSTYRLNAAVGLAPRAKDVAFDANVETSRGRSLRGADLSLRRAC
ncbi:hypothetical protein BDW60DRAFT_204521 [Aspergillus nidulans var. acristatus]